MRVLTATLLLGVLALAGCGGSGGPPIDRAVATRLADRADAVAAAGDPCTARDRARALQRQTIAAINAGRIPDAYLATLQSRVADIVSELDVRCLPDVAPQSTAPPPSASSSEGSSEDRGDKGKHGHGHEKHAKHEKRDKHGKLDD